MTYTGAFTAMVTPFTKTNSINFDCLKKQIEHQISEGISGLVPCGTTGESPTLTSSEKKDLIRSVIVNVNGRVPVLAGTGNYDTSETIKNTKWAKEEGADAALVITPYYNKPTQEGLYRHFMTIAEAVPEIDIIIYNVPSRTNVNILPHTVKRVIDNAENVKYIKEASGDIGQVLEINRLCSDKITILSGEDGLIWPYIASGAKGVISVVSNILPRLSSNLVKYGLNGDIEESRKLQNRLNPLIQHLFSETSPIPVKYAMEKMGFDVGALRLPLHEPSERTQELVNKFLKEYELI